MFSLSKEQNYFSELKPNYMLNYLILSHDENRLESSRRSSYDQLKLPTSRLLVYKASGTELIDISAAKMVLFFTLITELC